MSAALSLPASDGPASLLVSPELSRGASLPTSGAPASGRHVPVCVLHVLPGQSAFAVHSRHWLVPVLHLGVAGVDAQSVSALHWTHMLVFRLQAGVGAAQSVLALHWTHVLFIVLQAGVAVPAQSAFVKQRTHIWVVALQTSGAVQCVLVLHSTQRMVVVLQALLVVFDAQSASVVQLMTQVALFPVI